MATLSDLYDLIKVLKEQVKGEPIVDIVIRSDHIKINIYWLVGEKDWRISYIPSVYQLTVEEELYYLKDYLPSYFNEKYKRALSDALFMATYNKSRRISNVPTNV